MDEDTAPPPETKPTSNSPVPAEPTPAAPVPAPESTPTSSTPAATAPIPTPPPKPSAPTSEPAATPPIPPPIPEPKSTPSPVPTPSEAIPESAPPAISFPKPSLEIPAEQTLSPTEKPELPLAPAPAPTPTIPAGTHLQPAPLPGQGVETGTEAAKKILLVDDDPVFTQLYAAVFNSTGLNCVIAEHGLEALDAAKEEKPDLILLDIMMPDINGFEVLKRLKAAPATAQIPVWMLTNLAEQIDLETAASLGAGGYLVKSINTPKQICQKIDAFFAGVIEKP